MHVFFRKSLSKATSKENFLVCHCLKSWILTETFTSGAVQREASSTQTAVQRAGLRVSTLTHLITEAFVHRAVHCQVHRQR